MFFLCDSEVSELFFSENTSLQKGYLQVRKCITHDTSLRIELEMNSCSQFATNAWTTNRLLLHTVSIRFFFGLHPFVIVSSVYFLYFVTLGKIYFVFSKSCRTVMILLSLILAHRLNSVFRCILEYTCTGSCWQHQRTFLCFDKDYWRIRSHLYMRQSGYSFRVSLPHFCHYFFPDIEILFWVLDVSIVTEILLECHLWVKSHVHHHQAH